MRRRRIDLVATVRDDVAFVVVTHASNSEMSLAIKSGVLHHIVIIFHVVDACNSSLQQGFREGP